MPDPWTALRGFMLACADAGASCAPPDVNAYAVTEDVLRASRRARDAVQRLLERAQADGSARADVNAHDLVLILTELRRGRHLSAAGQPLAMYRRLAEITVDGLRASAASPLPEPPSTWRKVRKAWLDANPKAAEALNALSSKLDDATMATLNARVDVEKKTVEDVAGGFLKEQKLI